jgi:hypothetical protein
MQSLEKRLTALEAASPNSEGLVMFLHLVGLGEPHRELRIARDSMHDLESYQEWTREAVETEDDFKSRITREVKRNAYGSAILYSWDGMDAP